MSELSGRFGNMMEVMIFVLFIAGIFFVVAKIFKSFFKINIEFKYYYHIAFIGGFILYKALIVLMKQ
jgi:hypothetical protein|tara:strand:+ start:66 stop:266 length:201 start_codon:yes stop_codon:yes gene_type:complete